MAVAGVAVVVWWVAVSCVVALVLARAVRLGDARSFEVPRTLVRLPMPRTASTERDEHQRHEAGRPSVTAVGERLDA